VLTSKLLVQGVHVERNTEKPRKGTFEVVANGKTVVCFPSVSAQFTDWPNLRACIGQVSLEAMPRPFAKLKALDISELAEKVLKTLQGKSGEKKEDKEETEEPGEEPEEVEKPRPTPRKAKPAAKKAKRKATKRKEPTKGTRASSRLKKQKS